MSDPQAAGVESPQVLIVDDDSLVRDLLKLTLEAEGCITVQASDGHEALRACAGARPDLIISDIEMPGMDGLELLQAVRGDERLRDVPMIMLSRRGEMADVVQGLRLGADDYISKPFLVPEVVARVQSKLHRRPIPVDRIRHDLQTNALTAQAFISELDRELTRVRRSGRIFAVASIATADMDKISNRLSAREIAEVTAQLVEIVTATSRTTDIVGSDGDARLLLLLSDTDAEGAKIALDDRARLIGDFTFTAGNERLRLTPTIGFAMAAEDVSADELIEQAHIAAEHAALHLDLQTNQFVPEMIAAVATAPGSRVDAWLKKWRDPLQVGVTVILGIVLPFFIYIGLSKVGIELAPIMYIVVVISLLMTAIMIWIEGALAYRRTVPPPEASPPPPATAIIAAYLPNEAPTIEETIEAFLEVDYPSLQIILAYNTPTNMPIERVLHEIAERDPRFLPLRVEHSTSKAQNVNSALAVATGEFVGVFDADSKPEPHNFRRAWAWLSNGHGVVQGHNAVRNGESTWVARMVAVEFESIYSVSHPGRARLHGFGIFGGSNGYWNTDLLRRIRMHGSMLTEDIDSSIRVITEGHTVISDPGIICWELAPTELKAIWNQRMRWAQGWFQVSLKHFLRTMRSDQFTFRNKFGLAFLLGWREVYPWISIQMFPIIGYYTWKYGGVQKINWLVPIFVFTTIFTLGTGPAQAFTAYKLGAPQITAHKRWFFMYVLRSAILYNEMKNTIGRVSQIKEFRHERAWKVTPR